LQGSLHCSERKEAYPWLDEPFDKAVVLLDNSSLEGLFSSFFPFGMLISVPTPKSNESTAHYNEEREDT